MHRQRALHNRRILQQTVNTRRETESNNKATNRLGAEARQLLFDGKVRLEKGDCGLAAFLGLARIQVVDSLS
jgi:hypothetical protein